MKNKKIFIIDETIREGMQHRGLVFSLAQREKMIEFQENLRVDITQAGYPTAHETEFQTIKHLANIARQKNYNIKIAAMGRALIQDAKMLLETNINDFHFHLHIKNDVSPEKLDQIFKKLSHTIKYIRKSVADPVISIAMLDIGKTPDDLLEKCISFLANKLEIDILSLPDTSGVMAPNEVFDKFKTFASIVSKTKLSVHCHNDMGMSNANSHMGIMAGASILEASALGIGERNGIADLFCTCKMLKDQGFDINIDTDNSPLFKKYYDYVSAIAKEQTGESLLSYNTPFFGQAVKTHVAGTHAITSYGLNLKEKFFLNVLCGRHLVQKYLDNENLTYNEEMLNKITVEIKSQSVILNRCLTKKEITAIAINHK